MCVVFKLDLYSTPNAGDKFRRRQFWLAAKIPRVAFIYFGLRKGSTSDKRRLDRIETDPLPTGDPNPRCDPNSHLWAMG